MADTVYVTNQYPFKTYKALLTQTPSLNGFDITDFDNKLIVGETYTINNYVGGFVSIVQDVSSGSNYPDGLVLYNVSGGNGSGLQLNVEFLSGTIIGYNIVSQGSDYLVNDVVTLVGGDINAQFIIQQVFGDDFSNIADVVSGTINQNGCVFIATYQTPNDWGNGSELTSDGNLVVTELENNLGFNVSWVEINPGIYFAFDADGPFGNTFPREITVTNVNQNGGYFVLSPNLILQSQSASFTEVDDIILLSVYDFDIADYDSGYLFYTPVEINLLYTLPA